MMLAGAVLTGGRSSRMGAHKALVHVDGAPMAGRVAEVLESAGCDPVVLVGGEPELLRTLGREVLPDVHGGRRGPLAGIHTALSRLGADAVLVAACDLPDLDAPTVRALRKVWSTSIEAPDVVTARTDRREPLCAIWNSRCAELLGEMLAPGRNPSVREALDGLPVVVEVAVPAAPLRNVNTPDDLRG